MKSQGNTVPDCRCLWKVDIVHNTRVNWEEVKCRLLCINLLVAQCALNELLAPGKPKEKLTNFRMSPFSCHIFHFSAKYTLKCIHTVSGHILSLVSMGNLLSFLCYQGSWKHKAVLWVFRRLFEILSFLAVGLVTLFHSLKFFLLLNELQQVVTAKYYFHG